MRVVLVEASLESRMLLVDPAMQSRTRDWMIFDALESCLREVDRYHLPSVLVRAVGEIQ